MFSLLFACTASDALVKEAKTSPIDSTRSDSSLDSPAESVPPSACPPNMARIQNFCIDQYEASIVDWSPYDVPTESPSAAQSVPGVPPQGYVSGEVAGAACGAAGKRLCSLDEWMVACQNGAHGSATTYPYGNTYDPQACNDSCAQHPVVSYWGNDPNMWDSAHMNDPGINQQPDTLALTGEFAGCVTQDQVYDLHGNLHEWVDDASGTFKGGFYADGSINGVGCGYTTTAHSFDYHDYSTGFRCCVDVVD